MSATEFSASYWNAFYVAESTPGTTPTSATFVHLGAVTSAIPSVNPNYKMVRASGSVDYFVNQQMSLRPTLSLTVIPPTVAFLTSFVSADAAFTVLLRDPTNGLYLRATGCYVNKATVSVDVEDSVEVSLELECFQILTTNAPGTPVIPSVATTALSYKNVTLSIGGSTITDYTTCSFEVDKQLIRLLNSTTGVTRKLFTVARTHSLTMSRTMTISTGFDQIADQNADTSRTVKLLLTNTSGGVMWSVQLNTARTTGVTVDPLKPEDMVGKEITYTGTTLTFATS